jgi:hypothetical protein
MESIRLRIDVPKTLEQARYYDILPGLGLRAKRRSGQTALKQHRCRGIVCLKEADDGASVPEPQAFDFMRAFHMWHREFQDSRRAVRSHHRGDPGAASGVIEWGPHA